MDLQPLAIDLKRMEILVQQELAVFRELAPHSTEHHNRLRYSGSFVAWVAMFLPEAFSDKLFSELDAVLEHARMQKDFDFELWDLVAPLDAAAFTLSGSDSRLQMILRNLAHEKSFRRHNVQGALALVALHVPWDLPGLLQAIADNRRKGHGGFPCAAIVAVARGPRDAKLAALARAAEALGSACEREHTQLACGEAIVNPFIGHAQRTLFMTLHRLALLPAVHAREESERDYFWWSPFNEGAGLGASSLLWKRLIGYTMLRPLLTVTNNLAPWPAEAESLE